VRDNEQLAAGYVGSPPGMPHCDEVGHEWDETGTHCVRTIHAEQNAIIRAVRNGTSLRDSTVYCTMEPCYTCAKLLVGIGVYRIVALNRYHAARNGRLLLANAGVILKTIHDEELYERAR
jgi:dCMP deaminase